MLSISVRHLRRAKKLCRMFSSWAGSPFSHCRHSLADWSWMSPHLLNAPTTAIQSTNKKGTEIGVPKMWKNELPTLPSTSTNAKSDHILWYFRHNFKFLKFNSNFPKITLQFAKFLYIKFSYHNPVPHPWTRFPYWLFRCRKLCWRGDRV